MTEKENSRSSVHAQFDNAVPLVPAGIIRAWTNNEYRIGDRRSTDYEFIGAAFAVRGYYRYSTYRRQGDNLQDLLHSGYCLIDLDGPELFMAGVRVYTGANQKEPYATQRNWVHPIYWRSQFSKFVSDGGIPKVHFGYRLFKFFNQRKEKHYDPTSLAGHRTFSSEAQTTFQDIETFWSSKREILERICTDAEAKKQPPAFQESDPKLDQRVLEYVQDRQQFLKHLSFLQHQTTPETLVGMISVDVSKLYSEPEKRLIGAVFQPIDLVTA